MIAPSSSPHNPACYLLPAAFPGPVFTLISNAEDLDVLPRITILRHLPAALRRHLEQFPSMENGLSRTEQQALEAIADGVARLADVYVQSHHRREAAIFMGDAGFLAHLGPLVTGGDPLLRTTSVAGARSRAQSSSPPALDDHVELTETGRRVLAREIDRVSCCGIDRWLGGVHLTGNGPVWRWDTQKQLIRLG